MSPESSGDRRTPLLDVGGLNVQLRVGDRRYPVIEDLSFTLNGGEVLGIVGESGSGKSLTALSIMRMLPRAARVTSGSVHFGGRDLLTLKDRDVEALRGSQIGMVFQDPSAYLNPLMTVGQQIRETLMLHGMSRRDADRRCIELLELVGVHRPAERVDDYPHQFSGGMRQRVIIAIAVANSPKLIIADEPTTALDVTVQAGILRLLKALCDEMGAGLILITHDIGVVEDVCENVLVMYAGRAVEYGSVHQVLGRPRHPYTRQLMLATPRLDLPSHARLPVIPGRPPDIFNRPAGCAFNPRCPLVMDQCRTTVPLLAAQNSEPHHLVACWAAGERAAELRPAAAPPPADRVDSKIILDIADAHISYGGRGWGRARKPHRVVRGVDLQVRSGQAMGLVGESGCGKSTLARAIVGLQSLQSGAITVDGSQWTGSDTAARLRLRRVVQMVFQDPYQSVNPRQTVGEIVSEPLIVHKIVPRRSLSHRVRELMDLVGMPHSLLSRFPYQLSGGQRQRVGIARALAMEPKLIVADEPVSALDVSIQAQIINLVADLRDELGLGFLFITHDLGVVRHLCDDVAVMHDGVIVERGTPDELFAHPQHEYTRTLLEASPGWRAAESTRTGPQQ